MPLHGEYVPGRINFASEQAELYEATGGAEGCIINGKPIVVLTTLGAKSQLLRKTAVMRVEHDGEYAIVASGGGVDKLPVWYWNVKKNPRVELQDGAAKHDYVARQPDGDERALWWGRAVKAYPTYAEYQAEREFQIPIFILEAE